ncbi:MULTISPECIES: hypothetical protein [unclassified Nocardiopsis]|uniref:hypothetical protein n=1 Tax=unclassified Nocardiopsis TaxID=2649073 RepID=UPI0011612D82|nr:hypothetical protein [Nocardiopsis sp. TSRI0078]
MSAATAPTTTGPATGFEETVLASGDTVTVFPEEGHVSVSPAPGREDVRFTSVRSGGRHLVLPADARAAAAGAGGGPEAYDLSGTAAPMALADDGCGECHELRIRHVGPDGEPTDGAESLVLGLDGDVLEFAGGSAEAALTLPEGRYMLVTDITDFSDPDADWHRLVHPLLALDGDSEVLMDATTTRPVGTDPGVEDAEAALVEVGVENRRGGAPVSVSLQTDDFSGLHTAQVGPAETVDGLTSFVASTWAHRGDDGGFLGAPSSHHLLDTVEGSFPTGYDRTVAPGDLAVLTADHLAQTPGHGATKALFGTAPGVSHTATVFLPHTLPSTTVHHLEAGEVMWSSAFGENRVEDDGTVRDVTALGSVPRSYEAGEEYAERWNASVIGPMFLWSEHGVRTGDELWFGMPMYSDQDRHQGGSRTDSSSIRLFQDGALVGESSTGHLSADLAPGDSELRVESRTTRESFSDLSTRVEAVWTVSSSTPESGQERLPLWLVRYQPDVDARNTVDARGLLRLPFSVESQPGSAPGRVEEVTVEASADDGRTWDQVRVVERGDGGYTALVRLPRRDGEYLSLRARLSDSEGSTLEQTIIRALRLSD